MRSSLFLANTETPKTELSVFTIIDKNIKAKSNFTSGIELFGIFNKVSKEQTIKTAGNSKNTERNTLEIKIEEMAQLAGLSKNYFGSAFKKALGETPHSYLIKIRISIIKMQTSF